MPRILSATDFKATCLSVIDFVAETSGEVVITKRGRAVARLVPMPPATGANLLGSVTYADDDALLSPTGDRWEADQ